jgi:hypothetical protein
MVYNPRHGGPASNYFGREGRMRDLEKLDSMTVKQLEKLFANTLPGSIKHDLI